MRRYRERTQSKMSLDDQACRIIGTLEDEDRYYVINKAETERDTPAKVSELLPSHFGTAGRAQQEKEDEMQHSDALDGLRSQRFPQESIITKRYEILQSFMQGVRDPALRREFAIVNASETFLTDPSTVESLHFTTRQLQRNRLKAPPQPYDPRKAMRSRPHPFVPLQPNKKALAQGVVPPPAPPLNAPAGPTATPARAPLGACFNCEQNGHFARECPNPDKIREPAVNQPDLDEALMATVEDCSEFVAENGAHFSVNCGMIDHVASQCMKNRSVTILLSVGGSKLTTTALLIKHFRLKMIECCFCILESYPQCVLH